MFYISQIPSREIKSVVHYDVKFNFKVKKYLKYFFFCKAPLLRIA